ncbi:MAG: hypothetical protein JW854_14210 [Actinobacteria bacterium]|nr:hypothetical protein [Actinomycetota bacterium]
MRRYSRWTWVFFALAILILAGGAVSALLVWRARSSSTQEFLDAEAATEITLNVVDNTSLIAEEWLASDISCNLSGLAISQQESLALLSEEVSRTEDLVAQVEEPPEDMDWEPPQDLLDALALLSQAQAELEHGLNEFGYLLTILQPLDAAEAHYVQGREALISAVGSHNQAMDAEPISFSQAIQEASNAAAALQESRASLDAVELEGLDLGAAVSTVTGLESTAQLFIEACRRGEAGDIEGHNSLMVEVQSQLSASPASILTSIALASSLKQSVENYMQPVFDNLEEARARLAS